ncbi:hypothetical protein SCARD494_10286 [Seiridium cardinale]
MAPMQKSSSPPVSTVSSQLQADQDPQAAVEPDRAKERIGYMERLIVRRDDDGDGGHGRILDGQMKQILVGQISVAASANTHHALESHQVHQLMSLKGEIVHAHRLAHILTSAERTHIESYDGSTTAISTTGYYCCYG